MHLCALCCTYVIFHSIKGYSNQCDWVMFHIVNLFVLYKYAPSLLLLLPRRASSKASHKGRT